MKSKIKAIITPRYAIEMHEVLKGFCIVYKKLGGKTKTSETILDYRIADMLFEIKLNELIGQ